MISREICQRVLRAALSTGGDFAEIFAENTTNHSLSMIDSKVESAKDSTVSGAAVRIPPWSQSCSGCDWWCFQRKSLQSRRR